MPAKTVPIIDYSNQPIHSAESLRWYHVSILAALLIFGGLLRFEQIGRHSQWPDEFWSVYLSTGRGDQAFQLPSGKLLNPPPLLLNLSDAPPWWNIWTGMGSAVHPPIYHIVLRWWMDILGEADWATRSLSAVLDLIGVLVLFDILRRTVGYDGAVLGASVMTLAESQIDCSQETRSYTLVALLGLLVVQTIVRIEKDGATSGRLAQLAVAESATLLTHYLAILSQAGLGIYVLFFMRGKDRRRTFLTGLGTLLFTAAIWSPWMWQQYQRRVAAFPHSSAGPLAPLRQALELPAIHLYGDAKGPLVGVSLLILLVPLLPLGRRRQFAIWWLWVVSGIGSIALIDVLFKTHLGDSPKYTFLAAPGICALTAALLIFKGWPRWIVPGALLFSLIASASERYQQGPPLIQDWKLLARNVDKNCGPHEPLVFYTGEFWSSPAFWLLAFEHYAPRSQRPIMVLYSQANDATMAQLAPHGKVCLVGDREGEAAEALLPGWKVVGSAGSSHAVGFARQLAPTGIVPATRPVVNLPMPLAGGSR